MILDSPLPLVGERVRVRGTAARFETLTPTFSLGGRGSWVVATAIAFVVLVAAATVSAEPPAGASSCSGCHATSTRVASPVPRLMGLDQAAIVKAMQDFRAGTRAGTVMDRIAKGFTDAEIQAIAVYWAAQK